MTQPIIASSHFARFWGVPCREINKLIKSQIKMETQKIIRKLS
ncbi:hypothetical protein D026_2445 [Vibrio parahaemolyticus 605]|nr:hypothetical protein D035_0992 [Vibrio parahaemolyticus VP250]EQL97623.1 hypothetical protein D040_2112 [Vibrio parahaemolyticus NIHCB0603]EQM07744.1 hypothetical protein D036_1765 [Vibrio parahaemolyticus VP232]EQM47123.1 hypothetical protein D025_3198 [Vibrio parahaemolyticus 949]ETS21434.1 hypothetical protein D033_2853 [Vibrio parahaemolyticus B-265]ETT10722.1 hypothetical protein D026_2445 [Vibrio parahaemolyticus 605]ETX26295.1 hypothetical protein D037_0151 [Vibrio parahaemolyticus 